MMLAHSHLHDCGWVRDGRFKSQKIEGVIWLCFQSNRAGP